MLLRMMLNGMGVDRSLRNKNFLFVLSSWTGITSTIAWWRRSVAMRRGRGWTPVVDVFFILNVHHTRSVPTNTDKVTMSLSSHFSAHLGNKDVELGRDDDIEAF